MPHNKYMYECATEKEVNSVAQGSRNIDIGF